MYDNQKAQLAGVAMGYTQSPVPQSPVDQAMDDLSRSIQSGHEELHELTGRLSSVLAAETPKSGGTSQPERLCRCPQESRLQEMARAAGELSMRIRAIRDALCI